MEFLQGRNDLISKYMRTAKRNTNKELNEELKELCSKLPFPDANPFFDYGRFRPIHIKDQNRKAREGILSENTRLHSLNAELQDLLEEQKLKYEKELRVRHENHQKQLSDLKKQVSRAEDNCRYEIKKMEQRLEEEKEVFDAELKEARNAIGLSYISERNHSDTFVDVNKSIHATFEKLKNRIKDLDKEKKRLKTENKDLYDVAFGLLDDKDQSELDLVRMRREFEQLHLQCRFSQNSQKNKPLV